LASQYSSVLIVAKAALLRDGLEALLSTIPVVDAVYVAEEAGFALSLARTHRPRLILMDAEVLGPELEGFLAETAVKHPPPDCIVLVESHAQETAGLVSGAGEVLWKGLPADQLLARVRARLAEGPAGRR
jgi:DNA-binding NarL/FixJ family response regulator